MHREGQETGTGPGQIYAIRAQGRENIQSTQTFLWENRDRVPSATLDSIMHLLPGLLRLVPQQLVPPRLQGQLRLVQPQLLERPPP